MNLKKRCSYLVAFLACIPGFAQKIQVSSPPSWIKSVSYSTEVSDTTDTSGGYFDLLYDEQRNLRTRESYFHYAQKILSEKGLEAISTISEMYDPTYQELSFHSIIVHRNGQKINKLNDKEFQILRREENLDRMIYDGSLSAICHLTDLQVGDVLEYSFSYKGWNPAFGNNFQASVLLNYGVPVGKLNVRIICERNRSLNFSYANQAPPPVITEIGGNKNYEWSFEKIPSVHYEDGVPSWFDSNSRVEISSFKSWEEVARWAYPLYASSNLSSPAIDTKIAELRRIKDQEEMIKACIEFVQDEIRYLSFSEGIHGYKPHSANKVLEQRFGDCKDKSVLLSYLINRLGFESYPVLVHASNGAKLNEKLPSPIQFNHCISAFIFNDSTYWVDPTMSFQRGPLKERYFPAYYFGLPVKENATGLVSIDEYKGASKIQLEERFDVSAVGTSAKLYVKTTYYGDEANSIRDQFKSNSLTNLTKNYLNFYANDYPEIKSVNPLMYVDNERENVFVTEEEYNIEPFWKFDSTQATYSVEIYPRTLSSYLRKPSTKIRSTPFGLNYPLNISQRITLNMPEEWNVTSMEKSINSAGFHFQKSFYLEENRKTIHLNYTYSVKKPYLEAGEVKDHLAKVNAIYDNLSFEVSYRQNSVQDKQRLSPYYFIGAVCLIIFVLGLRKLNKYDPEARASAEQYSQIGGWLIVPALGLAFTPIRMTYELLDVSFFDIGQWKMLTDSNYAAYNPSLGVFILFEFILNIGLLCYSVFLCSIYLTRRTSLPKLIVIFYAANVFLQLSDFVVLGAFSLGEDKETTKNLIQSLFGAAIWIPYFLFSERVKGTFIHRY